MTYYEYNDLFLKCQDKGQYHLFTFDIVNSKKMDSETRYNAQILLIELSNLVYEKLKQEEIIRKTKILISNDNQKNFGFNSRLNEEPIILGDLLAFTVYRNSINSNEVIKIFNDCVKILNIDYTFHYADGYYETNDWNEANIKYFKGHCLQLLSELHKPHNKKLLIKINKHKL